MSPWPLTVAGAAGSGKTCAALCMCDHVHQHAEFHEWSDFCQMVLDARDGRLTRDAAVGAMPVPLTVFWHDIQTVPLLVVDDIGTRQPTDFQLESLKRVLDRRDGMPLVVTTNLRLAELSRLYDDRIASRLGGGTYVWFGTARDDQRLQ